MATATRAIRFARSAIKPNSTPGRPGNTTADKLPPALPAVRAPDCGSPDQAVRERSTRLGDRFQELRLEDPECNHRFTRLILNIERGLDRNYGRSRALDR